jgi:hypothetical protein
MSLSISLSERNEHEKFEKSFGMPLSHLSNPTSKVQRAKPPPLYFCYFSPSKWVNGAQHAYGSEEEEGVFGGEHF